MSSNLLALAGIALSLLLLDIIWLITMAPRLYRPNLGALIADKFRPLPAIAFYLIYVFGVFYFACLPAIETLSSMTALYNGAILGFVAYATYDLTNQATLTRWSSLVTIIDISWGVVLTATSASCGFGLWSLFAK